MKFTAAVVLCTLAVLLETSTAQYCSAPQCSTGSFLDQYTCQCNNFTKSVCPQGTSELVDEEGQCSCQEAVHPECDAGYTLNPNLCVCKIKTIPTCPNNTHLVPANAVCFGVDEPTCPKGFTRVGCKCVRKVGRKCLTGELTHDNCKCKNAYTPKCTGGCTLNSNGKCTCEDRRQVQCYYARTCSGAAVYVDDIAECCFRYPVDYTGDRSASPPHTADYIAPYAYRVGNGECYTCPYYYYVYSHQQRG